MLTRSRRCWVCDAHQYSVIFWNKKIGETQSLRLSHPGRILKHLKRPPGDGEQKRPILYTFKNQWMGQQLHTIAEYCFVIDRRKDLALAEVPLSFV